MNSYGFWYVESESETRIDSMIFKKAIGLSIFSSEWANYIRTHTSLVQTTFLFSETFFESKNFWMMLIEMVNFLASACRICYL